MCALVFFGSLLEQRWISVGTIKIFLRGVLDRQNFAPVPTVGTTKIFTHV